jgi:hypothetical protein
MTDGIGELLALLVLAAVVGSLGIAFGIFFLAPRISRRLDRSDEEPGAGDD